MTLFKEVKARCLICGQEYEYPESDYKPKTCSRFECIHKFLHPSIYDKRTRTQLEELRSERR